MSVLVIRIVQPSANQKLDRAKLTSVFKTVEVCQKSVGVRNQCWFFNQRILELELELEKSLNGMISKPEMVKMLKVSVDITAILEEFRNKAQEMLEKQEEEADTKMKQ